MSTTTTPDESETQTGAEPEAKPIAEPDPEPEPNAEPESEAVPQPRPDDEAEAKQSEAPVGGADPEQPEEPKQTTSIPSNDDVGKSTSAAQEGAHPELRKDQGSRTFTMRELLSGLKNDQGNSDAPYDTTSPYRF